MQQCMKPNKVLRVFDGLTDVLLIPGACFSLANPFLFLLTTYSLSCLAIHLALETLATTHLLGHELHNNGQSRQLALALVLLLFP